MVLNVYFAGEPERWSQYEAPLQTAFQAAGLDVALSARCEDPGAVDYLIYAPSGQTMNFSAFSKAKAVLNLWAGVEQIVDNPTLTQPLCRMVDDGLRDGMVEYVTGHVLRHHLGMDQHIVGTSGWAPVAPPLARNRSVAILGLGALGAACAKTLVSLGFVVSGWSRRAKDLPDVACFSGLDGLETAIGRADILVLLLPLTPDTDGIIDTKMLDLLPKGAVVINPGRGGLIDDDALLAALDSGQVGHATLDTFRVEPLPAEHPYWAHPNVTVTPHIASETRPDTAAEVIAENIRRGETGAPFLHLVNRQTGY